MRQVEAYQNISITWLRERGYTVSNRGDVTSGDITWRRGGAIVGSAAIRGTYDAILMAATCTVDDGAARDTSWRIPIARRPMPRGGTRLWLVCPLCERLAGVLYLAPARGDAVWACRLCHRLTYASQLTRERIYHRWDITASLATSAWGRKILLQSAQAMADERHEQIRKAAIAARNAPKRPRGRPKTKRAYTRHSLVTGHDVPTASAATCSHCGQAVPAATPVQQGGAA